MEHKLPPLGDRPPVGMPPFGGPPMGGPGGPPPGWTPPMADISWVKRKFLDVPYGTESKAQCFDLYLPEEGDGPFPLLIHIHGGGFAFGDKRDDHMDAYLTGIKRGYAVASVEYRKSGEAIFPAAVHDCREAIRYIRAHAAEYSVDPERIGVIGGSAGGNLTAMMGMNVPNGDFPGEDKTADYAETPFVVVAVPQFGPMSFGTMREQAAANGISEVHPDPACMPESQYIGVSVAEATQAQLDAANPATYASPAMVPMLVQHGTRDHLVPYAQSVEFVEALKAKGCGDRVGFTPLEGADHEDKMFTSEENLDLVFNFTDKYMK